MHLHFLKSSGARNIIEVRLILNNFIRLANFFFFFMFPRRRTDNSAFSFAYKLKICILDLLHLSLINHMAIILQYNASITPNV